MSLASLYLRVREREGRLYPDEIAVHLPDVPSGHPLESEWHARAASLQRLIPYLARVPRPNRILELGCGNGWLSHHLSALPGTQIWGLDRPGTELSQAARLFGAANLAFLAADIFQPPFAPASFDIVVVASAIQYFPDLPALMQALRRLLAPGGEIHLLDSPFYRQAERASARQRTRAHYAAMGFPEMADHYFHHSFEEIQQFRPRWMYRPDAMPARLARLRGRIDSPFPWVCIQ